MHLDAVGRLAACSVGPVRDDIEAALAKENQDHEEWLKTPGSILYLAAMLERLACLLLEHNCCFATPMPQFRCDSLAGSEFNLAERVGTGAQRCGGVAKEGQRDVRNDARLQG